MSIELMDPIDLYPIGDGAQVPLEEVGYTANAWSTIDIISGGKFGGNAIRMDNPLVKLKYGITAPTSHLWILGAYIQWYGGFGGAQYNVMEIGKPVGELPESINCGIRRGNDGSIEIYNANGSKVASSAASLISGNIYYYIEFKVFCDNTVGYAAVRINGVPAVSVSSIDTYPNAGYANEARWKAQASEKNYFDDLLIITGDGSVDETRDWIGNDSRMRVLKGNADTVQSEWDRSAGSVNYSLLNENIPGGHDGDSSYIETDTIDAETRIGCEDMPSDSRPLAVSSVSAAKETEANGTILQHTLKSGSSTYADDVSLTTGYKVNHRIRELDPDGDVPWTVAKVNALGLGAKLVAEP